MLYNKFTGESFVYFYHRNDHMYGVYLEEYWRGIYVLRKEKLNSLWMVKKIIDDALIDDILNTVAGSAE